MINPESIFTAPEEFLPAAQQRSLKSPSSQLPPAASTQNERRPQQGGGESRTRYSGAWAQTAPATESLSAPEPSVGSSGLDKSSVVIVTTPGQPAGTKRSAEKVVGPGDQQPQKKSRLRNSYQHTLSGFDFPHPHRLDPAPAGHPPSPLFFSNSSHTRPPLPPRFSSGEAGERMLRQADTEESKVRTVKLARAAYSGSSPPAIGLSSYKRTPSTFQDAASPEV
jgi:hypothetical protein